ncbi:hypothetical protein Droror1_Dr00019497 [Drosera rotundifolia]
MHFSLEDDDLVLCLILPRKKYPCFSNEDTARVKGLMERGQSLQAALDGYLSPCSKGGTKRLRGGGGGFLLPCSLASTNRTRSESAEESLGSAGPPVPSFASTFSLTDLPDVLLLVILLLLTVKSTFKCKSLCKRCRSLISGYYSSTPSFTLMFQHEIKYAGISS